MTGQSVERVALVVDDQPMMVRLCNAILTGLGYRVLRASSKSEALKILEDESGNVTLLLTDIVMASESEGIELAEQVTRLHPHIPVIYMSGYARGAAIRKLLDDDTKHFLQKPFVVQALEALVRRVEDGTRPA
jgi:DNA-binding NtrC family response regulator